jgi:hypothetical protein
MQLKQSNKTVNLIPTDWSVWGQGRSRWGRDVPTVIAFSTTAIAITALNQQNQENPIEPRPKDSN